MTDYLSMSFYNHIWWLKQKVITTSDTQSNNIKNWGRQRAWNRGKVSILQSGKMLKLIDCDKSHMHILMFRATTFYTEIYSSTLKVN